MKLTPETLLQETLISLVTLPTLALLFATRSATLGLLTAGRWSEELLRGDRLPPITASHELHGDSQPEN
jgi:hypothetical protein